MFHDQCALNVAFAGEVQYLESRYNFFLKPNRLNNGDLSDALLLHYLDKPKPWDIAYQRDYRAEWLPYAGLVRLFLKCSDYRRIVIAGNDGGGAKRLSVKKVAVEKERNYHR